MAVELKKEVELEIAHVLFIDIVAYSKMPTDEQRAAIDTLNQVVQSTDEYQKAQREHRLLKLATGDGMALIFYHSPEDPVECALEISRAIKQQHPELHVRMGVHSGPVSGVVDVNGHANVAGAGINMAQRVMDCGDAGHILVSRRVAEDLEQFKHWREHLFHLGECEVKHGDKIEIINLFTAELGNPERPSRLTTPPAKTQSKTPLPKEPVRRLVPIILGSLLVALAIGSFLMWQQQRRKPPSSGSAVPEKSIAVLPFENLSDEKQNAYFADGVQDEVLTNLAKVADLKVISRTSVMQYKTGIARNLRKIGEELGVAHVLEGSVQRANNRVRVNAQLVDARNDAHLWAETYDRDLADIFAIQSEIAKAIADQLRAKILPREKAAIETQPTKDLGAYDLYVRGSEALNAAPNSQDTKGKYLEAISLFEQALARDPSFFNAQCKLAQAHDQLYLLGGDHTPERLALAEQAVNRAAELQPDAPEAHLTRGNHLYSKLDYDGARAEIEMARRALPNDSRVFESLGYIGRRQGQWEESTRNLERALELDPQNVFLLNQIGSSYEFLHQYSKAAAVLDRAIAIRPSDLDTKISRAVIDIWWKADPRRLHDILASTIRQNPQLSRRLAPARVRLAFAERNADDGLAAIADLEDAYGPDAIRFPPAAGEGLFARLKGDFGAAQASFAKARTIQQRLVDAQPDYAPDISVLAVIDASLGRKDEAIREGRRAAELMPLTKDSVNGANILTNLAIVYAWVGEKDLAIEQLRRVVQEKGRTHYGQLRLFPQWDPLRGDPRFEQIVASLAPKQ